MSTESRRARESEAHAWAMKNAAEERIKKLEAVVRAADAYIESLPSMQPGWVPGLEYTEKIDYFTARAELGEIGGEG